MKKNEFEALLKLQDRYLLMCEVHTANHTASPMLYAADVETRNGIVVMSGPPAKTPAAAVQKSIARYYKQNANH
jgi:hypothetical protein